MTRGGLIFKEVRALVRGQSVSIKPGTAHSGYATGSTADNNIGKWTSGSGRPFCHECVIS